MSETKTEVMVGVIFAGIGSIFAVVGIAIGLHTRSFVNQAIPLQGTVRDFAYRSSKNGGVYYPVVEFTVPNGERKVVKSTTGTNPPFVQKGQQIKILHNPQEPNSMMIDSWVDLWLLPIIFTGLGTIFLVIGGGVIVFPLRS
jgi:hypothetical protein